MEPTQLVEATEYCKILLTTNLYFLFWGTENQRNLKPIELSDVLFSILQKV